MTHGQVTNYTCKIQKYFFWPSVNFCVLSDLNVTPSQKHFRIVPNYTVSDITGVHIQNSQVTLLTSDTCEILPFVTHLLASNIGPITAIEENAFQKCVNLEFVDLSRNSLRHLPSKLFTWNEDILTINFWSNKLTKIDENLFKYNQKLTSVVLSVNRLRALPSHLFTNNPHLKSVNLADNQLAVLSFLDEMPVLRNVTQINLASNKLSDVDVVTLIEKLPNLQTIDLGGSAFLCPRQQEIKTILKQHNVTQITIGNCILDSEKTNKTIRDTQLMAKNETAKILWAFENRLKNLTSENESMKDELQVIYLVVIILGSVLIVLIIGISGDCLVRKIRTKYYASDYEYYERNNIRMDSCNVPVNRNDPYYTYVPGFSQ